MNYDQEWSQPFSIATGVTTGRNTGRRERWSSLAWSLSIVIWGSLGVLALFADSIGRLSIRAFGVVAAGLTTTQWIVGCGMACALCYVEGYRALQERFVPRVVARLAEVSRDRGRLLWRALAPLYALSLVGGNKRELVQGWATLMGIVCAIGVMRHLPTPWRGIIDGGVAVALCWGVIALLVRCGQLVTKICSSRG